ncbi:MAG TPA: hypothetical protein PKW56_07335 [Clostridiales bacterium]|nr:hypothetical protein [Clostridiales bacterium]
MSKFVKIDNEKKGLYLQLLSAVSQLSGLFSESSIPYINYRVAENIFCNSFGAKNLSRSDTAFDASIDKLGVGIKTFVCTSNTKTEKIAEFNLLSSRLRALGGYDLAYKISEFRNERISLAKRLYNIDSSIYHIVARRENKLILFETDYDFIDLNKINSVKASKASLHFEDGKNSYTFSFSKSTLFRKFEITDDSYILPVKIADDPFNLILKLLSVKPKKLISKSSYVKGKNYIVLPLYGYKNQNEKFVFEKSGINQWNAGGRARDYGEIYIPIPKEIHIKYPDFFPGREIKFKLTVPSGEELNAKVCQQNSKALMTDPNKALSDWLLRKVLRLKEGELATIEKLRELGFDSVIISKNNKSNYKIDIMKLNSYERFILSEDEIIYPNDFMFDLFESNDNILA